MRGTYVADTLGLCSSGSRNDQKRGVLAAARHNTAMLSRML